MCPNIKEFYSNTFCMVLATQAIQEDINQIFQEEIFLLAKKIYDKLYSNFNKIRKICLVDYSNDSKFSDK